MSATAAAMKETACTAAAADPTDETLKTLCAQATGMSQYTEGVSTGLDGIESALDGDGTEKNPGLVAGSEAAASGARTYADSVGKGLDLAFDGTSEKPGLIPGAEQLAEGARTAADEAPALADGISAYRDGMHEFADGVDSLSDGADDLAAGANRSSEGAGTLATGMDRIATGTRSSADGAGSLATGLDQLADGSRTSADGASALASGADQSADGARASSDGANTLAAGLDRLADGSDALSTGAGSLASGTRQLADGSSELASGTDELADGSGELATGADDLATGLQDGVDDVPTYSESQREGMSEMGAKPIATDLNRDNEADGAATATFPFVAALALWLGAFGAFLLLPSLSPRLLKQALPMRAVALRSLLPFLGIALAQSILVLAVLTALGIAPVSPLSVGLVALAGAAMFMAFHQALLTLLGERVGRITSILVMVLQVVALVGILPVETAPPALQAVSDFMPLSLVTEGLVHAALGGSLVTTSGVLGEILVWALGSVAVTLLASRGARRMDLSGSARARMAPAGA